jgi:hypothetical protein
MTTTRARKPKPRPEAKSAPDPILLLPKLRMRLEQERVGLERWQKRLVRTFHAYERQYRSVARLDRRIHKLENT